MRKTVERLDDATMWRAIYEPRSMLRELYSRALERAKMSEDLDGTGSKKSTETV